MSTYSSDSTFAGDGKEGRWRCTKRPWNETLSRMIPLFAGDTLDEAEQVAVAQLLPTITLLLYIMPCTVQYNTAGMYGSHIREFTVRDSTYLSYSTERIPSVHTNNQESQTPVPRKY